MKISTRFALGLVATVALATTGICAGNTTLTSTTTTPAGDSTSLTTTLPVANGGTGVGVYSPSQVTAPYSSISASAFVAGQTPSVYLENLPHCPSDPSCAPGSSTQTPSCISGKINAANLTVQCPDINGKWQTPPTGSGITAGSIATATQIATYCPDVCQTSRYIVLGNYASSVGTTITQILNYTPPLCPPGYAEISATNPQASVLDPTQQATPPTTADITDINQLYSYLNQGMTCYADPQPVPTFTQYCSLGSTDASHPNTGCIADSSGQYNNLTYNDAAVGTYPTPNGTYVGVMYYCDPTGQPYAQNGQGTCTSKLATSAGLAGSTYNTLYSNFFYLIKCKPTGLYLSTTSQEPATLICARVKSAWQKQ